MAGGSELLDESDYFHPFMTHVFLGVLKLGLPVWIVHAGQLAVVYGGFVLLVQRLFTGWRPLLTLPLLLLPPVWNFSVLQASDTWFLAGCFWYLAGMTGRLRSGSGRTRRVDPAAVVDFFSIGFGSVLMFCTRYNAAPLVLVVLAVPFLFRLRLPLALALALLGLSGFAASKIIVATSDLPESHKLEMMMASDVVGIWKELHRDHPQARPAFWDSVPDGERFFAKHDPHNHDTLVWTEPLFRAHNLGPLAADVRSDFFRYLRDYPGAFLSFKLKTFQNPWGFVEPLGAWYFKPAPDSYIEFLGIDAFKHRPLVPAFYRWADWQLQHYFKHGGTVLMRPWIWWLAYLVLLGIRFLQGRVDRMDALILFMAAGYFATFFVFSNGFLLRYFLPVFVLLALGGLRLAGEPARTGPAFPGN